MSRIGKKPLAIPENTTVTVAGRVVTVKGPLGELAREIHSLINVAVADGHVNVSAQNTTAEAKMLWGTWSSHIMNMMEGVTKGYTKKLIVEGIGYKSDVKGDTLAMSLGFSHPVNMKLPKGLKVTAEKNLITITGQDKELVGQFAAQVRANKVPEPYKGKGIRYDDETIRRKEGKKTA
ncbi:MAG: 50S ribosomal protein L6 [Patescibacteria group bacterium]